MSTPHNSANLGDIAKTVLMPGDPLRAKFIAETFFENAKEFSSVRGMLGYSGEFNGRPVSVMGSGMGMPSMGIYSYELFKFYGVENIIRVGSAGSYCGAAKVYDVVLTTGSYSESSFAKTQSGDTSDTLFPSVELNRRIKASAEALGLPLTEGVVHSSDVFYREDTTPYFDRLYKEKGCLCVDMESFALFNNANVLGKNAACLLTISDSLVTGEATSPKEREQTFTAMMKIALGSMEF